MLGNNHSHHHHTLSNFDHSSGGSNCSSASGSSAISRANSNVLPSSVGSEMPYMNGPVGSSNLASFGLDHGAKLILNNDLYDQLMHTSALSSNHGGSSSASSSSTSSTQAMHNPSIGSSTASSSTQLTRSNSPQLSATSGHRQVHHIPTTSMLSGSCPPSKSNAIAASSSVAHHLPGSFLSNSSSSGNALSTAPFAHSLYDRDEGIGESPTFDSIAAANLATAVFSTMIGRTSSSTTSTDSPGSSYVWPDLNVSANSTAKSARA